MARGRARRTACAPAERSVPSAVASRGAAASRARRRTRRRARRGRDPPTAAGRGRRRAAATAPAPCTAAPSRRRWRARPPARPAGAPAPACDRPTRWPPPTIDACSSRAAPSGWVNARASQGTSPCADARRSHLGPIVDRRRCIVNFGGTRQAGRVPCASDQQPPRPLAPSCRDATYIDGCRHDVDAHRAHRSSSRDA